MPRISRLVPLLFACWLWPLAVSTAAWAADRTLTLYGVFHQTSEGSIVFHCPQQPEVVYLPFDPGSIMGDVLDIQVQVRGEIRDSFQRDGKTVHILAVSAIKPLTAEYGATTVTRHARFGLPGADAADIHAYSDKTCYLYARYAVLERLAPYSDGHSLRVLARNASDDPSAVCEDLQGTPLFAIPNGGDFHFAGLAGDTLLVQNGPPKAIHGLMAVNLARKKQTLEAVVAPGSAVVGRSLRYDRKVAGTCPDGGIAIRPMTLDLVTGRVKDVGKTRCWRERP